MKQLLIMAMALLIMACNNENNGIDNNPPVVPGDSTQVTPPDRINPEAILSVCVREGITGRSGTGHYSPRFITLYASDYIYSGVRKDIPGKDYYWRNRDTVENKITFMGWDVLWPLSDSTYILGNLITGEDVLLRIALDSNNNVWNPLDGNVRLISGYDTVSYIPNSLMRRNEKILDSLFAVKDYEGCYQMFDTAYRFIPITGAEWLQLKKDSIE